MMAGMSDDATDGDAVIRTLALVPPPLRPDELIGGEYDDVVIASTVRRTRDLAAAIDETAPDVIIVWTGFAEGRGIDAIGEARALAPEAAVLALTPDPPPHGDVALATRAGAGGFVDIGVHPSELVDAIRAVDSGVDWFPNDDVKQVLAAVAGDLDTTRHERQSRLIGIAIGLVPITGAIAAMLSLLYRRYLGQIGVRPVDIAIEPASRVIDAVSALFFLLGFFGPLLFVGTWLTLLRGSPLNRGPIAWLLERRRMASLVLTVLLLAAASLAAVGIDLVLVLVVGPAVAVSLLARALGLESELPRILRLEGYSQRRAIAGGVLVVGLFVAGLAIEALFVGPSFNTSGAQGYLMPTTVGFKATPMLVRDVESGRDDELLYLGGNADLYVMVDPCDDDKVFYVSVGSTRLLVIDEVDCADLDEPDD